MTTTRHHSRSPRGLLPALIVACLACDAASALAQDRPVEQAVQDIRWTESPPRIDGQGDDPCWRSALVVDRFSQPWTRPPQAPSAATRAKLLWDRTHLYFLAELDDQDVWADISERDGPTWNNDVVELFLKPAADRAGYYEFQVNAANTQLDMFLPERAADGYFRRRHELPFDFRSEVRVQGTLNQRLDRDQGWTVEGALAWESFAPTGGRPLPGEIWQAAICRYDYTQGQNAAELSTTIPATAMTTADFHRHQDYGGFRFTGAPVAAKSTPWMGGALTGSPEPPRPYVVERVFPRLKLDYPVCLRAVPGFPFYLAINETGAYAPAKLQLFPAADDAEEAASLLDFDGVAYDIAFHPRFAENGYFYVGGHEPKHPRGPHCRVTRYSMSLDGRCHLDRQSASTIIEWDSDGHNGAAIDFGLDGMLYVTTGDGTSSRDTDEVGQRLDTLRAKVLRIDVDHPDPGKAYSIPRDNPFLTAPGARGETWCYGLRNPWRISVDRQSGQIWVGNNGQDAWEQAYLIERGANYGWSVMEGGQLFIADRAPGPHPISKPAFDHPHSEARSLTGGVAYHGQRLAALRGTYIYGDYSTGKIWGGKHDGRQPLFHQELADTTLNITCFTLDHDGELLIADHRGKGQGGFYRLRENPGGGGESSFPRLLSETGLFASTVAQLPADGVTPYQINAPAWHDGARLERWVAIPADTSSADAASGVARFRADGPWELPEGSVLAQTLSWPAAVPAGWRRLETRILLKDQGEWNGYSYAWNDEQTDARLVPARGQSVTVNFNVNVNDNNSRHGNRNSDGDGNGKTRGQASREKPEFAGEDRVWRIPGRAECMSCHSRAANYVLGFKTEQLNRPAPGQDSQVNQLQWLEARAFLQAGSPEELEAAWRERVRQHIEAESANQPNAPHEENERRKFLDEALSQRLASVRDIAQRPVTASPLLPKPPASYATLASPDGAAAVDQRARAYLQVNCAHCHVPDGGGNAKINLPATGPASEMHVLGELPLHGGFAIGNAALVAPGAPDRSVLLYRMASLGAGRMPRVGSRHVDVRGLRLIREWIEQLAATETAAGSPRPTPEPAPSPSATIELRDSAEALRWLAWLDQERLGSEQKQTLIELGASHAEPAIRDLFERFLPESQRVKRLGPDAAPDLILTLTGDPAQGERLFRQSQTLACRNCHRVAGQGQSIGPDLDGVGKKHDRRQLLDQLLNPSALIDDKFASYVARASDGRVLTGLLRERTAQQISLQDASGKIHEFAAQDIEELQRQPRSLMPDQALRDLTPRQAADLLDYLHSLK